MRKSLIVVVAIATALALTAATAFGALSHDMTAKVTPSKAGTKKKPRNLTVSSGVTVVKTAPDVDYPTAGTIEFTFPKQFTFNNKHFKKCTKTVLTNGGVSACPSGSQVGSGTAKAVVGPGNSPLWFDTTFFNAGSKSIVVHLQRVTPDSARQPLEGDFEAPTGKLTKSGGKWKLAVVIPDSVKNTAAGFSKLLELDFKMNKKYRRQSFIRSTGCSKKKYTIGSRLLFVNNPNPPSVASSSKSTKVTCKK